uniref:ATP synthase complex subunit 8 n=1 Tax=Bothus myriaster TaxID=366894 RepID=A0A3G0Z5R4_BOTMY|nr:ATP synthase F0 subunit 8 [Bothus myriaster]AID59799.1 ATP synthase F0 subunit 8 [Bothus myriaster]
MPQLNPSPWFLILVFSWLVFLTIIPNKLLSHTTPNEFEAKDAQFSTELTWFWPWP